MDEDIVTITVDAVNTTPHDIVLIGNGPDRVWKPDMGFQLRVVVASEPVALRISAASGRYEKIIGKSPPVPITISGFPVFNGSSTLIVSMMAGEFLRAHPEQWDGAVIGPNTNPDSCVRDDKGIIIGVKSMIVYKHAR